ncbi:Polypeptide N-acetylgalactosaminyltransferase 17 [Nibea albiflora]|uniref:Polypeptide N-acetylgalactosaminyltransferase 17 n=1 Tax=Nibea albiflora TaxID=240163 RepID=A0ACB7ELU0_NIBAL|nr:Polypeptide N-acetylgalactosaminyltransferase 17 [Nibea albiflora]
MRNRQRGSHLGLLLLGSQLMQVGLDNIPPVTLAVLGLNVYLYLFPAAPLMQACVSVQQAYWYQDWRRLLLSPLHHADDWHLYFNMASFLWKGIRLERRLGGAWFAYLLSVFSLLIGLVYLLVEAMLTELTQDQSYSMACAVGFSGVLFALKVLNNHYHPGGVTYVMGLPVSNRYASWAELVLIHITSPGTSFVGHLSGILVGLLYTAGPLKTIMKTCAGFVASNGNSSRPGAYYNSSGYSGAHGGYSGYTQHAPDHTTNPSAPYTGGLTEEEQLEAAIRNSLNDRGQNNQRDAPPPPYGFNLSDEATAEEIRQRRLRRRWRVLLVLNVLAVAGFMTFWTKCNTRSVQAAGPDAPADGKRPRGNGTAQGPSVSHEVLLKRLSSLEDVVYRQLNGLSKSLGLIEGFGGRGRGGLPATLSPSEESDAKYLREKYGYNAYLSDRISLDRTIPDHRPGKCRKVSYPRDLPQISLIFIFVNEALSVILRSVHSAVNHTPAHLLKEIILVDDNSDDGVTAADRLFPLLVLCKPPLSSVLTYSTHVNTTQRSALVTVQSSHSTCCSAFVILASRSAEQLKGPLEEAEPVLARIKEDHKRIILPSIDNIKHDTFEVERYENSGHGYNWELWCMYINPPKQWTPAMIGCSFVANRDYFGELGLLDSGMDVYGGENIELGIRVWLCGGSMEVLPCSRVAHIARMKKPYHSNIAFHTRRNALRVAEVWMDEYKSNVYLAWNIPMENHGIDYGDISQRVALRKSLQCKSFEWYLDNVYPEMRRYNNTLFYGEIRNSKVSHLCMDQGMKENHTATLHPCHGWGPQLGRYTKEGQLFLGALGSTGEDTHCVVDDPGSNLPQLLNCDKITNVKQKTWHFSQNDSIINRATGRCLEVVPANVYFGHLLVLQPCSGQRWNIKNTMKQ